MHIIKKELILAAIMIVLTSCNNSANNIQSEMTTPTSEYTNQPTESLTSEKTTTSIIETTTTTSTSTTTTAITS